MTAVGRFKSLVTNFKNTNFGDIIKKLIDSVKQLPRKVINLRRIGTRIFKKIGEFTELPPVVTTIKDLVTKVTTLFKDIKTDIMNLHAVSMNLYVTILYVVYLSFYNIFIKLDVMNWHI